MTKIAPKGHPKRGVKCAHCGRGFKPPKRGRPPRYCCAYHRQLAYQQRRASCAVPMRLLKPDIVTMQTKVGIRRAVIEVLRELGLSPPAPGPSRSRLRRLSDSPHKKS